MGVWIRRLAQVLYLDAEEHVAFVVRVLVIIEERV